MSCFCILAEATANVLVLSISQHLFLLPLVLVVFAGILSWFAAAMCSELVAPIVSKLVVGCMSSDIAVQSYSIARLTHSCRSHFHLRACLSHLYNSLNHLAV